MSLQELVDAAHPDGLVELPLIEWNRALLQAEFPKDNPIDARMLTDLRMGAMNAAGHASVCVMTSQAGAVLKMIPLPGASRTAANSATEVTDSSANPSTEPKTE